MEGSYALFTTIRTPFRVLREIVQYHQSKYSECWVVTSTTHCPAKNIVDGTVYYVSQNRKNYISPNHVNVGFKF